MKRPYVFEEWEMAEILQILLSAKMCLCEDSPFKIEGCQAAINRALSKMTVPRDSVPVDMDD